MKLEEIAIFTDQVKETAEFYLALGGKVVYQNEGLAIIGFDNVKVLIHTPYQPGEGELPCENHIAFGTHNVDKETIGYLASELLLSMNLMIMIGADQPISETLMESWWSFLRPLKVDLCSQCYRDLKTLIEPFKTIQQVLLRGYILGVTMKNEFVSQYNHTWWVFAYSALHLENP